MKTLTHQLKELRQASTMSRSEKNENWQSICQSLGLVEEKNKSNIFVDYANRMVEGLANIKLVAKPAGAFALIMMLFVVTSYATVNASQNSLPGNPLYQVKIGAEKLRYMLSFSEEAKTQISLAIAKKRAQELALLSTRQIALMNYDLIDENNINSQDDNDQQINQNNLAWQKVSASISAELNNVKNRLTQIKQTNDQAVVEVAMGVKDDLQTIENSISVISADQSLVGQNNSQELLNQMNEVYLVVLSALQNAPEQSDYLYNQLKEKVLLQGDSLAKDVNLLKEKQQVDYEEQTQLLSEIKTIKDLVNQDNNDINNLQQAIVKLVTIRQMVNQNKIETGQGGLVKAESDVNLEIDLSVGLGQAGILNKVEDQKPTSSVPVIVRQNGFDSQYFADEPWLLEREKAGAGGDYKVGL